MRRFLLPAFAFVLAAPAFGQFPVPGTPQTLPSRNPAQPFHEYPRVDPAVAQLPVPGTPGVPGTPPPVPTTPTAPSGLGRAELDRKAAQTAFDIVSVGVEEFNKNNQEGCLRLYEGALTALAPFLDHRPELQKTIADKFAKARSLPKVSDKAFALREALDAVMAIVEVKKPLWERLGGEKPVTDVVKKFLIVVKNDKKVNFLRDDKFKLDEQKEAALVKMLVEMISQATGGPLKYSGKDMKKVHEGMKITEDEFDALVKDFTTVLETSGLVKADVEELKAIVESTRKDIVEVKK